MTKSTAILLLALLSVCSLSSCHGGKENCPPTCNPPNTVKGCNFYRQHTPCKIDELDLSVAEAECGCQWQKFIQSLGSTRSKAVENSQGIFTDDGEECYVWASTTCGFLSEQKGSTRSPLLDILERLSHIEVGLVGTGSRPVPADPVISRVHTVAEVGKHRRRNGVQEQTVNTYGSIKRHGGFLSEQKGSTRLSHIEAGLVGTGSRPVPVDPVIARVHTVGEVRKHRRRNGVQEQTVNTYGSIKRHGGNQFNRAGISYYPPPRLASSDGKIDEDVKSKAQDTAESKVDEFIGWPAKKGGKTWIEVKPENKSDKPDKPVVVHKHHHYWFDLKMQDDEFKLWIFITIVLLNILVVLCVIVCRSEKKKSQKEVRPSGDLDPNMFSPGNDQQKQTKKPNYFVRSFIDKLTGNKNKRDKQKNQFQFREPMPTPTTDRAYYCEAIPVQPPKYLTPTKRPSRGLYENLDQSDEFDMTYEEPVPSKYEFHPKRYIIRREDVSDVDSSPDRYIYDTIRRTDDQGKSVSFSIPSGVPPTLDSPPGRRRRGRKGMKGALVPIRMGMQTS